MFDLGVGATSTATATSGVGSGSTLTLTILPEIQQRLFPLREEELQALRESIEADGVRDPLVVWPRGDELVLVDGHHRYRIARELGVTFRTVERHFDDLEEVLAWIDLNQLGRRNLTDEQRALVMGRLYEARKLSKAEAGSYKGKAEVKLTSASGSDATAKDIAQRAGVSEATVRRSAKFARAVEQLQQISPQAAERVLRGEVRDAITRLPKVTPEELPEVAKRIEAGEGSIKKSRAQIDRERKVPQIAQVRVTKGLRHGDFREVLRDIPDGSVKLILTDPPYPKRYLGLWGDLARFAARVLRADGILVAYSGQMYLPEVINVLSEHLDYWWTGAIVHKGSGNLTPLGQPVRKVVNRWKPLLMFVKRGGGIDGVFHDLVAGSGRQKDSHNWQQPVEEAISIIEQFTAPGDLVVDPFAGSNTVGVAAEQSGREYIGAEISDDE